MGKQIVYLTTREDTRTAILLVAETREKASAIIDAHVKFKLANEGATLHRDIPYEPAPVKDGTMVRVGGSEGHPVLQSADPVVCCCLREVELIENDGIRVIYRVTQHCVQ